MGRGRGWLRSPGFPPEPAPHASGSQGPFPPRASFQGSLTRKFLTSELPGEACLPRVPRSRWQAGELVGCYGERPREPAGPQPGVLGDGSGETCQDSGASVFIAGAGTAPFCWPLPLPGPPSPLQACLVPPLPPALLPRMDYVTGTLPGSSPFRAVWEWSRHIRWFPKLNNVSTVSHTGHDEATSRKGQSRAEGVVVGGDVFHLGTQGSFL